MTLETVVAALAVNLSANKTVGVLLRVEIIERPLKIERTRAILSEHSHKRAILHKYIAVKGRVDIGRDVSVGRRRVFDIS